MTIGAAWAEGSWNDASWAVGAWAPAAGGAISFSGTVSDRSAAIDAPFGLSVAGNFTTGLTPIAYSLQAGTLPTGLSLNTSTGVISGTPTVLQAQAGIVIRGTDTGLNTADTNAFAIQVVEATGSGGIQSSIQSANGIRSINAIKGEL